ncbi:MAG: tyrosine--tRNA ligase [Archaeoglobaceae archaeon]|nr:tyrosine--tRNA ligase [Archaeoglobaceae archaeon]MCX8151836.1 tyrosine--tRNA ligase [Archaeoglobaceae archaeon]MDW8014332.1 tyrosine--tRNA ligase [Archaeoglobaceae archaeon]
MDLEEKIALATRNAEEVVTEDELKKLFESRKKLRAYAGYEPSGEIHLGHMITVQKLVDLKEVGFEVVVLLADIHAYLNEKGTFEEIAEITKMNRKVFMALGLEDAKFVLGSEFQLEEKYMLDVLKFARITTLNRAKRSMDEVSRRKEDPMVSQMIYPLMQSLDIAYLEIDVAVGGIDQRKIHMLARENLPKLGYKVPTCIHTPILPGLDGQKMSSSKGNYISVRDSPETVEEKLKKAYCPIKVVENNPVIEITRFYIFPRFKEFVVERDAKHGGDVVYRSFDELRKEYEGGLIHPLDLKVAVARYLNKILDPARKKLRCQSE